MAKDKKGKQPTGAGDLQKIISDDRERKRVQETADKIFGKPAGGFKKAKNAGGPSLKGAGVNKHKAGPVKGNSLAARATGRGAAPPTGPRSDARAKLNAQGLADALFSKKPNPAQAQINIVPNKKNNGNDREGGSRFAGAAARAGPRQQAPPTSGLTIKGLAGPHVTEIRGFAPGTTAADIEEALRNEEISVHSCRILQMTPTVHVDILCETKEDADRLQQFHQQWTDFDARTGKGFQLFVFAPRPALTPASTTTQPSRNNGIMIDGSMGFEPLPVDYGNGSGSGGLYSDQLMQTNQASTHQDTNYQNSNQTNNRKYRGLRGGRGSNNR